MDKIDKKQFCGDRNLVSYIVPETVTEIGDWAFARCRKLNRIAIPRSLQRIGREAFAECENLNIVFFYEEALDGDAKEFFRDTGSTRLEILSEEQRFTGELIALALRYFPDAFRVVDAIRMTSEKTEEEAVCWTAVWEEVCEEYLARPESDGFVPFLAGGEEDYADDEERLTAYCEKIRMRKAKIVYLRLLAGERCEKSKRTEPKKTQYLSWLYANDMALRLWTELSEHLRTSIHIYEEAGLLTEKNVMKLLEMLPEDRVEARALLMRALFLQTGSNGDRFMDGLKL